MPTPLRTLSRPLATLVAFSMLATMFVTVLLTTPASAAVSFACGRGVNLSFEEPVIPDTWRPVPASSVPGWETAAADGIIELWVDGFLGVAAPDGGQISELQANGTAPMYQDIPTAEGDVISWSVLHKGRVTTDTAEVRIGAPGSETVVQSMVTSPTDWVTYGGTYAVPSGQTTTRFMLNPIGSGSVGNLVDNVALALTCELDVSTNGLSIADTDLSGTESAGDIVTVTFGVTNTGTATLLDLAVSDAGALTTTCASSMLTPGATTTCTTTYTLSQGDLDSGDFSGSATVAGRDAANVSVSDSSLYSLTLVTTAAFDTDLTATLDISVTNPVGGVSPGDTITYTGSVTNTGNVTISSVAALTDVSGSLSCAATALAPGESTDCTATYLLTQGDIDTGSVDATGSFSATPAQGADLAAAATADVVLAQEPGLTVVFVSDTPTYSFVGATIGLTVTVTNTGNVTIGDIDVSQDMEFSTSVDCGAMPFLLAPGESLSCTATRTIVQDDLDAGSIAGSAIATGADPSTNPVSATSDVLTLTADQQPSITLETSSSLDISVVSPSTRPDVGDRATITYTITNTGNVTLSAISLSGMLGSSISCPTTVLAPSGVVACSIDVELTQDEIDDGVLDASATVVSVDPNSLSVVDDDDHTLAIDQVPSIDIATIVDDVTSLGDGTYTVLYTVTVSNIGNTTLWGLDVQEGLEETFPNATVTLTAPTTDPFESAPPLAPGSILTATYTVVVVADGDDGPYETTSLATASSPAAVVSSTATVQVALDVSYDLSVTVGASPTTAPGASYTQRLTVTNSGPAAALGPIVVTMTLDPSVSYQGFTGAGWVCTVAGGLVTCTRTENVDAGTSADLSIVALIDADLGETLEFQVAVGASNDADDANPSDNALVRQVSVEQLPVTGVSADLLALIALMLLAVGTGLIAGTRKRTDS